MAGVDFDSLIRISVFLICLYLVGRSCRILGVSPIIGEMIVGVLLGPNVADFVPNADFWSLAGVFGVTLMIFESGMHLDFEMLKTVGPKAGVVAVLGTFLPLGAGMLLIHLLDNEAFPIWPTGLAVGVALAPTSVGMGLKMLGETHQLGELYGQLIVTAAFIDDILSLVGLTMLLEIGKAQQVGGELPISNVLSPLFLSIGFCAFGALLAYPMHDRKGFVRKYLLCWVGLFPQLIPPLVELLARLVQIKIEGAQIVRRKVLGSHAPAALTPRRSPPPPSPPPEVNTAGERQPSRARIGLKGEEDEEGARTSSTPLSTPRKLVRKTTMYIEKHTKYHAQRLQTLSHLYAKPSHEKRMSVLDKHRIDIAKAKENAAKAHAADNDARHSTGIGQLVAHTAHIAHDLASHVHLGEHGELHEAHDHHQVVFDLRERVLLLLMFGLLLFYGWVSNLIGSHLLGAFTAGVSFCWMDHHAALVVWHSQVKRIAGWLIRLFFGATVAFAIPIKKMLDAEALYKGLIIGLGPCIGTKLLAGAVAGREKWVVGFAMVGRGEFAYLVAQTAQAFVLTPAPDTFATFASAHPGDFALTARGSYCYQCPPAASGTSGRRLAASGGSDGGGGFGTWCKRCIGMGANATCDALPVAGVEYWTTGASCNSNPSDCPCEMMLSPEAFSITVWALVLASVIAPLGFGFVLRRQLNSMAKEVTPARLATTNGAANGAAPALPPAGMPPAPVSQEIVAAQC